MSVGDTATAIQVLDRSREADVVGATDAEFPTYEKLESQAGGIIATGHRWLCAQEHEVQDGVSLINIYRTLAEMSGLEAPDYVDGFSLVPQLENPQKPLPTPSICSWGRGNYTIRDRNWRYTLYYDGGEELYSHANDPDEWTNLADNPEHAAVKKRLAAHLPNEEVPIVMEGLEGWSIPVSADKPLGRERKNRAGNKKKKKKW